MIKLHLEIIDESSGECIKDSTAYIDERFETVTMDALRKIYEDCLYYLRRFLEKKRTNNS